MNLKKKLSIIVLLCFTLNMLLLFGYYELVLYDKIEESLNTMQIELRNDVNYISSQIKRLQGTDNIKDWINNIDNIDSINISIERGDNTLLYEYKTYEKSLLNVTFTDLINIKDNVYMIKVERPLQISKIRNIPFIKDIVVAEVVIGVFILIFILIIIYYKIVNPIMYLQKDIENYKFGIKPIKTNRCDEIGWLKNNFVELTEKLDEEKKNQNRIIASISHDIKTPLTSIMGYSEMIKNKNILQERKNRYMEIIYSKSQNIKELIDEFDIYLGSNLESSIKKKPISVKELSKIIDEEYRDELTQLCIEFDIKSNCDESILNIDMSKMRRVFGNIIGNSIKNMKKDYKKIEINFNNDKENILISIADNGCGVDDDKIDKIFEALYTSDKSRNVAGLGLSICKSIVECHGGKIYAKNNFYGGLTIVIVLKYNN